MDHVVSPLEQEVVILARKHWLWVACGQIARANAVAAQLNRLLLVASGFERDDDETVTEQRTIAGGFEAAA